MTASQYFKPEMKRLAVTSAGRVGSGCTKLGQDSRKLFYLEIRIFRETSEQEPVMRAWVIDPNLEHARLGNSIITVLKNKLSPSYVCTRTYM